MKIGKYKTYQKPPDPNYGEYKWIIKERYAGLLWKIVYDHSKTISIDLSGGVRKYPYYFDSEKEADNFIINHLIGKEEYRDMRLNKILKK